MYTLTLSSVPPLQWSDPDIMAVGPEHGAINGEVPNMTVTIDNARGQHTTAVAVSNLLRLRAELTYAGKSVFSGAVQAISLGSEITFELEA
ncbi:MAG: hypothetical protein V4858_09040 [Pseudomonadota bacterium]